MNTSANVDIKIFQEIDMVSRQFKLSNSYIFKDLVYSAVRLFNCDLITGNLTEYQDHSPKGWKILHFSLNSNDAEIFSMFRQKFKISVSKLAFIGFLFFWKFLILKYAQKLSKKNAGIKNIFDSYERIKKSLKDLIPIIKKKYKIIYRE